MNYKLKDINCPLCGMHKYERLVPTRKLDLKTGSWRVQEDISITLCLNCGLVFEYPQIDVFASREYNENHYYNDVYNSTAHHDWLQGVYAPFRWAQVKDRINWPDVRKAVDVGGLGVWSALLKKEHPHIESILLEPSGSAIEHCKNKYLDVVPVHSTLEEYSENVSNVDVFTFFYSLYHVTDPVGTLRKCRNALSREGKIIICISQAHLELNLYGEGGTVPWVDMQHYARGVMLTYFSRRTLERTLQSAGFSVCEAFVAEHTDENLWKRREDYFVIAERTEEFLPSESLHDEKEVLWAREYVRNYCVNASRKSIAAFISKVSVGRAVIVHSNVDYAEMVSSLFSEFGIESSVLDFESCGELSSELSGENVVVFNVTWPLQNLSVSSVACVQGEHVLGDFDLCIEGEGGEMIMTKAFLPTKDFKMFLR